MVETIRHIKVDGNDAYVSLTKGYEAIIDVDDVPLVCNFNWRVKVTKNSAYAIRTSCSNGKEHTVYMHRLIMGNPSGFDVDHIDRNGLNNRKLNLRKATLAQNQQNSRMRANNSSGLKGVWQDKSTGNWRAKIRVFGRIERLGTYRTPEEAHAAYCKASAEYHGEFGRVR